MKLNRDTKVTIALGILWLITQAALLCFFGINAKNEALKYIKQAYFFMQQNRFEEPKYIFYSLPILLIALSIKIKAGYILFVVVQILFNGISSIAFYKTARYFLKTNSLAVVATVIFITFVPYQTWNSFLYTESVFLSLSTTFIYTFTLPENNKVIHLMRLALLFLLVFTRPLGLLYLPVLCFFYLATSKENRKIKIALICSVLFLMYTTFNYLYNGGAGMDILKPQKDGNIICLLPSGLMNKNLNITASDKPLNDLAFYIFHNSSHFFQLASLRLLSFFNLFRNSYSASHNIYLVVNMCLLYVFSIASILRSSLFKQKVYRYIFIPLSAIFCLGVMLQCDDYNSRFTMPLFPLIIIMAIDGMNVLLFRPQRKKESLGFRRPL
jgi:hypothetical protein